MFPEFIQLTTALCGAAAYSPSFFQYSWLLNEVPMQYEYTLSQLTFPLAWMMYQGSTAVVVVIGIPGVPLMTTGPGGPAMTE